VDGDLLWAPLELEQGGDHRSEFGIACELRFFRSSGSLASPGVGEVAVVATTVVWGAVATELPVRWSMATG